MGLAPETEIGARSDSKTDVSTYKTDGNFASELESMLMKFTTSHEGNKVDKYLVEQTKEAHMNAVNDVDRMKRTKSGDNELLVAESQQTTECSSSFDGSDSEVENVDTVVDSEALSEFRDNAVSGLDIDGAETFWMRKKRLTAHWRSFIQPLMWRVKWAELQMKKLQSQAEKYDRKIDKYSQKKHVQVENSTLEDIGVKSVPFSWNNDRRGVLRRRKRKRSESTTDLAAYLSRHSLFSYYENRKSIPGGALMDDKFMNPASQSVNIDDELWVNDESLCLDPGDNENSWEHMLWKIDILQSRVGMLKSRADNVISENAGKLSGIDMLCDALISSIQRTASSPNNGYTSDVPLRETAVSRHGEVIADVNGSTDLACFANSLKNGDDEVLIENHTVKEVQNPQLVKNGSSSTSPVVGELNPPREDPPPPNIHSVLNLTAPKSKRKRGGRKGAGSWIRRSSS